MRRAEDVQATNWTKSPVGSALLVYPNQLNAGCGVAAASAAADTKYDLVLKYKAGST